MSYAAFLDSKSQLGGDHGFNPVFMPDTLFPLQTALVEWACRKGRAALLEDCGLGKTLQERVWAENVVRKTNRPVLILCPLAVSEQTVREGEKFGLEVFHSRDGTVKPGVVVSNYERIHLFNPNDFAGVACDESSILKNCDGARRAAVTEFLRRVQYRLLATATAAPNDYVELGTSSEALGQLGHVDMLNRFFRNTAGFYAKGEDGPREQWRFKGHAEREFWRWVCSWARAVRKPSDLGFDDGPFVLPRLIEREHVVAAKTKAAGLLFEMRAVGLPAEREEARRTIHERCEKAAELINAHDRPAVAWCHLNPEGKLLAKLIRGAREVSGSDSDEKKEDAFLAFARGDVRVLVTKDKIGAFGLNWQHCAHMTRFPSHSYEGRYQAIRRCYRFGQTRDVVVDDVVTEGGSAAMANLRRKGEQAEAMFSALVAQMNAALAIERTRYGSLDTEVPQWLSSSN